MKKNVLLLWMMAVGSSPRHLNVREANTLSNPYYRADAPVPQRSGEWISLELILGNSE